MRRPSSQSRPCQGLVRSILPKLYSYYATRCGSPHWALDATTRALPRMLSSTRSLNLLALCANHEPPQWGTSPAAEALAVGLPEPSKKAIASDEQRAPAGQLESLFEFWEASLWDSNFFGGDRGVNSAFGDEEGREQEAQRAASAMAKLRRLILRGEPSKNEASLFYGVLRSLARGKSKETE